MSLRVCIAVAQSGLQRLLGGGLGYPQTHGDALPFSSSVGIAIESSGPTAISATECSLCRAIVDHFAAVPRRLYHPIHPPAKSWARGRVSQAHAGSSSHIACTLPQLRGLTARL